MLLVAACVSHRQPVHEPRQLAGFLWPQEQAPMIGHPAVPQYMPTFLGEMVDEGQLQLRSWFEQVKLPG
jgi:hypothetical protein